jgi:hypothetical protein
MAADMDYFTAPAGRSAMYPRRHVVEVTRQNRLTTCYYGGSERKTEALSSRVNQLQRNNARRDMMSRGVVTLLAMALASGLSAPAQQTTPRPARPEQSKDIEVVYGRIKEVKAGQKIVIDVDNAKDRTYNLEDKDRTIKIAEDLAVGDPVKILETKSTKAVQIVRDTGQNRSRK